MKLLAPILFALLAGAIGYGIGVSNGSINMANWCVDTSMKFLSLENDTIKIDRQLIETGIFMYKNHINSISEISDMCNITDFDSLKKQGFKNDGYLDTNVFNRSS